MTADPVIDIPAGAATAWQTAEELRRRLAMTCTPLKFRAALRVLVIAQAMETRIAARPADPMTFVREYRARR